MKTDTSAIVDARTATIAFLDGYTIDQQRLSGAQPLCVCSVCGAKQGSVDLRVLPQARKTLPNNRAGARSKEVFMSDLDRWLREGGALSNST
jgi:hypothetical protein